MRSQALVGAILLVAVSLLAAFAVPTSPAAAASSCFGKPATHVMQPGEGTYFGTTGDDVVVGSTGPDVIDLFSSNPGGTDFVCGLGGNDDIIILGSGSQADGGTGNDRVNALAGGLARGGAGDDLQVMSDGGRSEGGSGDDVVQATNGATADGGSGNDLVQGLAAAALLGGSGSDRLINQVGNAKIDCGSGDDRVFANSATDVRRCEGTITF